MRFIEIHVDAVLDPRYIASFRDVLLRRGVLGGVRFWQPQPTWFAPFRAGFARRLCEFEWRMSRALGRHSPVELIYADAGAGRVGESAQGSDGVPSALVLFNSEADLPLQVLRGTGAGSVVVRFPRAPQSDLVGLAEVCAEDELVSVQIEVWRPGDLEPLVSDLKIKTLFTLSMTQEMVMRKTISAVADCLWRLQEGRSLAADFTPKSAQPFAQMPPNASSAWHLLRYVGLMAIRACHKAFDKVTGVKAQWLVQLSRSNWRHHEPAKLQALSNPRDHYRADPFVVSHGGKTIIFVEEFSNETQRGHIAALQVSESGVVSDLGVCLREPFHLSFPFVFKWQGQVYMCPESNHSRQVRVYRCDEFPMKWSLDTVIMDNVAACDTMLFERDGRWWLLANLDSSGLDLDFCSELYLFWSDSPLSTQWTPHPLNPVVRDGRKARNGGIIIEDGRIYRVAQGHTYRVYGQSHAVYEITVLNDTEYVEVPAHRNLPPVGSLGAHHLSSTGEWTVSDSLMRRQA
jgi:hypothetical protein